MRKVIEDKNTMELLPCPFCGSVADHESTVCEEVIRCQGCFATMIYNGSASALFAMWNTRSEVQ